MSSKKITISCFAKQGGVNVETIRFYQRRGLLPTPKPGMTSFREYEQIHFQQLRFIQQAKLAGFSLDEIKSLLQMNPIHERLEIQTLAKKQLAKLNQQIKELQHVSRNLRRLVNSCEKNKKNIPCPIIESFLGLN